MIPTVGRIVHYTNLGDKDGKYPPEQQAAIITKVVPLGTGLPRRGGWKRGDERGYEVSLHVFYETGDFFMKTVPFSAKYKRGCWTWAPKV